MINSSLKKPPLIEIRFTIRPPQGSAEAIVLNYLLKNKSNLPFEYKQMIIQPVIAFWLPLANSHWGNQQQVESSVMEMLCKFQRHSFFIREYLELSKIEPQSIFQSSIELESIELNNKTQTSTSVSASTKEQDSFSAKEQELDPSPPNNIIGAFSIKGL